MALPPGWAAVVITRGLVDAQAVPTAPPASGPQSAPSTGAAPLVAPVETAAPTFTAADGSVWVMAGSHWEQLTPVRAWPLLCRSWPLPLRPSGKPCRLLHAYIYMYIVCVCVCMYICYISGADLAHGTAGSCITMHK